MSTGDVVSDREVVSGAGGERRRVWLGIFALAVIVRAAVSLVFWLRHGWQATNLIEIWFYAGVARGALPLSPVDPTTWILRPLGLLPPEVLSVAVTSVAWCLGGATAALVYALVRRLAGERAAIHAGLAMALLPGAVSGALVGFTHDLVQLPLILAVFCCVAPLVMPRVDTGGAAVTLRGARDALRYGAAIVLVLLGLAVGPLMLAALLVIGLAACVRSITGASGAAHVEDTHAHRRPSGRVVWRGWLGAGVLAVAALGLGVLYDAFLLEWLHGLAGRFRDIDLESQRAVGAIDLSPIRPHTLWNRGTMLLAFVPAGLWIAWQRRIILVPAIVAVALPLALVVSRGTRLLDLGIAMAVGLALATWGRAARFATLVMVAVLALLPLFRPDVADWLRLQLPERGLHLWAVLAGRGAGSGPVAGETIWLALLMTASLIASAALAWFWARAARGWLAVSLVLCGGWTILFATPASDQLEYEAYRALDAHAEPGERVFASWNHGYFVPAVTELEPVQTVERVDASLFAIYWMNEASAHAALAARDVRYVHVSSRYFSVLSVDPATDRVQLRGSTIIGGRPPIERYSELSPTLLYKLLYAPAELTRFALRFNEYDERRDLGVRIYELR